MGMFDEIIVKKELPIPDEIKSLYNWNTYKFQTKCLENCLLDYIINEDGELILIEKKYEYISYTEEERKKLKTKPWNLFKETKLISEEHKKIDFHGKIIFYTYDQLFDDKEDFILDLDAYFVYGKLDKIELVEFKKTPSRSLSLKKWEEELKIKQSKISYKIKSFIGRHGWNFICRKTNQFLFAIESFIGKIRTFCIRFTI
jgi:hypothetical protein